MNEEFIANCSQNSSAFRVTSPHVRRSYTTSKRTVFGARSIATSVMKLIVGCTILKSSTRR